MSGRCTLLALAFSFASAIAVLGSPLARAAEPAQRVVRLGFVRAESPSTLARSDAAFFKRLGELGWFEGRNLIVERRWAEGHIDRLPALMADVINRKVDVIVTAGTPAAIAAKDATSTVPIVIASMGDPVASGVAASLSRPGGNVTGLSLGWTEGIPGKWLELLWETIPRLTTVAVIGNPDSSLVRLLVKPLNAAASTKGMRLRYIDVREPEGLERAFDQARRQAKAAIVLPDPLTLQNRQEVTSLAAKYRLPAIYGLLEFVEAGGLIAYAPDHVAMFRRAAGYVDRILRGAKPADLPIEQPTQFTLAVNLKTAKGLR
ncbi:MAG: ABC transporter substrate-binding protein, partial [Terriglobales bacterium]